MNSVEKGRTAEAKVVAALVAQGHEVFMPVFGNSTCDLIAIFGGRTLRIETKYVTGRRNTLEVSLRQVRPNRTTVVAKKFNAKNCDVLAVYAAPVDKVAFLPAEPLNGRTTISLRESMLARYEDLGTALEIGLPRPHPGNRFGSEA